MQEEKRFFRTVCTLAIPAALQSLLQSSFSLVDQIMIGQLGAVSVAAVGLAGKFASIYAVVIAAIGAVAGIMISQYLAMLLPLLICEVTWSLGENVYAAIYGRMGTDASAAMTLTAPVQGLVIGALCGLSQAAGVIVGKRLGSGDEDAAYAAGRRLLVYGAAGAALLSVLVVLLSGVYVEIYQVEDGVKRLTRQILTAYALVAPCKVLNMILGGGILRSGGRTAYVMVIDLVGTWGFGVPAGLVTAFVFALPVPYVYFALSLEECLRFSISLAVFRRRRWMRRLPANTD